MSVDENLIEELNKTQSDIDYELELDEKKYPLREVSITKSPTPVSRPTQRGGVYFSDTVAYKMRALTDDSTIIPLLSKTMLGPNTEFGELEITVSAKNQKIPKFKIYSNLTNSKQSNSTVELNLVITKTENT